MESRPTPSSVDDARAAYDRDLAEKLAVLLARAWERKREALKTQKSARDDAA